MLFVFRKRQWLPCEIQDVKQGDFYYVVDNKKGSVRVAKEDARLVPHKDHPPKKVWEVEWEPLK